MTTCSRGSRTTTRARSSRWPALVLLSTTQLVVVLDISVVNVALPSIQDDLGFSRQGVQWVITAYALAFGGLLLLGGRAGDLLGRRRMLVLGLGVFGLASGLAGLAWDDVSLIGARALQGLGAATVSPAALSILSTTFAEGRERNVALGAWSAAGGLGGALGMLLGGALTDTVGWEWAFFVNLPIAGIAIALTPLVLRESRDRRAPGFDALGALLVTAGVAAAVLAISRMGAGGGASVATVGIGAGSALLLTAFVITELRVAAPLVPLRMLRRRTVSGGSVVGLVVTAAVASMSLMLTLYTQQVLGFSPLQAGLAYLLIPATTVVWSPIASRLVSRAGARPVLVTGVGLLTGGLLWFARAPVDGSYARDLLPGLLAVAVGMALSYVAISVVALSGVEAHDAGIGSGLLGASQQIGAVLGIAAVSAVAVADTGTASPRGGQALAEALRSAFGVAALIALAALILIFGLVRRTPGAGPSSSDCVHTQRGAPALAT